MSLEEEVKNVNDFFENKKKERKQELRMKSFDLAKGVGLPKKDVGGALIQCQTVDELIDAAEKIYQKLIQE